MLDKHLIAKTNPKANERNIIEWKNYRVTVLQSRLFRLEKSETKKFRDHATQSVWFRDMPPQDFTVEKNNKKAVVDTGLCKLILREKRQDCRIEINRKSFKIDNSQNLLGTYRTLDCCDGGNIIPPPWVKDAVARKVPLGTGVCSKTGVAVLDDSSSLTFESGEVRPERSEGSDEYLFAYGDNYREAVKALYQITGKVPMIPRFALGNWWSRYHVYTEKEYLRLLNKFEEKKVPLTVATIDMDWHYSNNIDKELELTASGKNTDEYTGGGNIGWTGYTWNKNLFPDYKAFLKKIQKKNLKITLNLHPADGFRWWEACYKEMAEAMGLDPSSQKPVPFDFTNDPFINAYFKLVHKPYEKDGVAFWWIDWQQGTKSKMEGFDPLWALNHFHYLDNAENHSVPLILSRYSGVGSHRYPLGFSGDTHITWKTLEYLPYFTLTASNVGYTWWSHDIGGHTAGEMNGELYVRHLQFGVFSPINRLHCCEAETMTKEPWVYKNGTGLIAEEYLRLRHRMIPYLYSASYRTHSEGLALIEPLYYQWNQKEAYQYKDEYLFGSELLVAPVTQKMHADGFARVKIWLPEGKWTDIFTGDEYQIGENGKEMTLLRRLESIPALAKEGAVLPFSGDDGNSVKNPERLEIWTYNGENAYTLYEDGTAEEKQGKFFTEFKSEYAEKDGCGLQSLEITSNGDGSVIPENRQITVRFKNIIEGEIVLYANGEKRRTEELLTDCASIHFPFSPDTKYRIEVRFRMKNKLEKQIERAKDVLVCAEGDNNEKRAVLDRIRKAGTLEEYVSVVSGAKIKDATKLRLAETM